MDEAVGRLPQAAPGYSDKPEPVPVSAAGAASIPSAVPRDRWYWCGYPGHFCAASSCRFHLHTRIGAVIVSTVGDYHPAGSEQREEIGYGRRFETFVFAAKDTARPEGEPASYGQLDSMGSNDSEESERQHYAMCERWATAEMQSEAAQAIEARQRQDANAA